MSITVFDAVGKFSADTSQLDQFIVKLEQGLTTASEKAAASTQALKAAQDEFRASILAVSAAGGDTADNLSRLADAEKGLALAAAAAKQEHDRLKTSLVGVRASTHEARGEAMLLGEAFGIHLPRHVTSFVAKLPGVGEALSSAFAATAVLFLIEALVKGSLKLSDWIANAFIFTQAMKDSNEATVKFNQTLEHVADETAKHQKALDEFGKSASALAHDKLTEITKALADNEKAFKAAEKTATEYALAASESFYEKMEGRIAAINRWLGVELNADETAALAREDVDKKAIAAQEKVILLAKQKADLELQQATARREAAFKDVEEDLESSKQKIAIDQTVALSQIKAFAALRQSEVLFSKDSATEILKIQHDEAEQEYQLKLDTLKKERAAEEQAARGYQGAGDTEKYQKQLQQVEQTNAKIEALNAEHNTKEIQVYTAFQVKFKEISESIMALKLRALTPMGEEVQNFQKLADAASRLGVTLANDLGKNALAAKNDLALLAKELAAGHITLRDYQQAEMKALEAQIAYDKELGKAPALVKAEEKELDALKKKFDDAYGKPAQAFLTTFFSLFHKVSKEGEKDAKDLTKALQDFGKQTSQAYATAIMGAIQSGESIGAALEKATKQILLQLATQALAQSIYSLGLGFLRLAEQDYADADLAFTAAAEFGVIAAATGAAGMAMPGGGGGGGAPGQNTRNPAGLSPTQSSFSGGGSQQTTGVTHLAAGGVIVAGEAGPEAVLPLDDRRALDRITGALSAALVRSPGANLLLSSSTMAAAGSAMARGPAATASALPESPGELDGRMERTAERLMSRMAAAGPGAGPGDVHLHFPNLKTILSPKAFLKEIAGPLNRMVQNRQITINASNSLRLTKRSQ